MRKYTKRQSTEKKPPLESINQIANKYLKLYNECETKIVELSKQLRTTTRLAENSVHDFNRAEAENKELKQLLCNVRRVYDDLISQHHTTTNNLILVAHELGLNPDTATAHDYQRAIKILRSVKHEPVRVGNTMDNTEELCGYQDNYITILENIAVLYFKEHE